MALYIRKLIKLILLGAIQNVPSLYTVNLNYNELTTFTDAMIFSAPELYTIELRNNRITDVQECKLYQLQRKHIFHSLMYAFSDVFSPYPVIWNVDMRYNRLTTLKEYHFAGLTVSNTDIYFGHNQIDSIEVNALKGTNILNLTINDYIFVNLYCFL